MHLPNELKTYISSSSGPHVALYGQDVGAAEFTLSVKGQPLSLVTTLAFGDGVGQLCCTAPGG